MVPVTEAMGMAMDTAMGMAMGMDTDTAMDMAMVTRRKKVSYTA